MSAQTIQNYEVKAGLAQVRPFSVAGISVVTDNSRASDDINALWERFFKESIGQKIEARCDDVIYAVYSDYQGDYEAPYRLTIGYRLQDGANAPQGFDEVQIIEQDYAVLSAAGQQPRALIETWQAVWASDLSRSYKTDFEVYGPRFFEEGVHEVLVHVGIED